jgi:hypothetical protein
LVFFKKCCCSCLCPTRSRPKPLANTCCTQRCRGHAVHSVREAEAGIRALDGSRSRPGQRAALVPGPYV